MTFTDLLTGRLSGSSLKEGVKAAGDLAGYWLDNSAIRDPEEVLYRTQTFSPVQGEPEGLVLWGNTVLMRGRWGDEFFMTRGHRHLKPTHGELCVTVSGNGALLLMDEQRHTRMEEMRAGSTHWIDGRLAHRTVNTGGEPLVFLCAWPADCGHDYEETARLGFSARLLSTAAGPKLVDA